MSDKLHPKPPTPISLTNGEGLALSDKQCTDCLNNYICSVFTKEDIDIISELHILNLPHMNPKKNGYDGVVRAIENLNLSSSSGDDLINFRISKNTKHIKSVFLTDILLEPLSSGSIPCDCKISRVIPLHKSGFA